MLLSVILINSHNRLTPRSVFQDGSPLCVASGDLQLQDLSDEHDITSGEPVSSSLSSHQLSAVAASYYKHRTTKSRFHLDDFGYFNSPSEVLFNFPSRYLFAVGL